MDTKEITDILNKISIEDVTGSLEYNPLEIFVNRVREKEICHTAIIADLLNPYGKHQLGSIFLFSFLKKIGLEDLLCYLDEVKIIKERSVQSSLPNKEKRSIDICIDFNKNKYAIIIENKMNNAPLQKEQISDYKKGFKQEGYQVLKTVCLKSAFYKDIGADINITPRELASIFETSTQKTACGINSYLMLLRNMDKETDLLKNAEIIWNMDDSDIRKIRTIASSFNEIHKKAFEEIVKCLNRDKSFDFKEAKSRGNGGDIYQIVGYSCLQLWNEESYHDGDNKGSWIEIWFYDFNRFEIWIKTDEGVELLGLDDYCKSKDTKNVGYYVDKRIDIFENDGIEAKKFDFPNKEKFKEMIDYVSGLYRTLYCLN